MNCTPHTPERRPVRRAGVALVIVLGMLVLIAVLVVAFLSSVSVELRSAKSYASESDARGLADSAVNIVISQIQDATCTPTLAWASQPGMIRTYDSTGDATTAYKLYSSNQLRVEGAFDANAHLSKEVPADWSSVANAVLYTDLNQPVAVSNGITTAQHYPIIDPAAVASAQDSTTALTGGAAPVPGCYLNSNTAPIGSTASQTNPLPMPVQWLYVLKNGSVVAMDPATRKIAGAGQKLPDGTVNTIVGRIAYWTDDESCKVNVNTASEGSYWDRPWVAQGAAPYLYERNLAFNRPAQNEFQRYPGHPAMTCLSAVFPPLSGESPLDYGKRVYGIIPRVVDGGSQEGTVQVDEKTLPLVPDTDRLFATVDEFLFKSATGPRQANLKGPNTPFTEDDVDRARFFLTTNSRAPEVNLFNKPRICLWPLQANTANIGDAANAPNRNAEDKLIAFCSTIGKKPYYFQRYNTYTGPTQDPIPSSQSPTMDWTNVSRNQELYGYLQSLTGQAIPGLGGIFGGANGKYNAATRDQILTEIFDFIRSSVNTFSTAGTPKYYYTPFDPKGFVTGQSQIVPLSLPNGTKGFGRFPTITEAALVFYRKDKLIVSGPTVPGGSVLLPGNSPLAVTGTNIHYSDFDSDANVGVVLILEPFNPTPGPPPWTTNARFVVTGLGAATAGGNPMGFPTQGVNMVSSIDSTINATALTGLETFLQKPTRSPKTLGPTTEQNPDPQFYPLYGNFVTKTGAQTFDFSGGEVKIEIYQGGTGALDSKDLVQTIHMAFPPATLPVPTYARTASFNSKTNTTTITDNETDSNGNNYTNFNQRLSHIHASAPGNGRYGIAEDSQHNPLPLIILAGTTGDTVRSVEARYAGPARGDYRVFAGLREVPADYFEGHGLTDPVKGTSKLYNDSTVAGRLVHSLTIDGMAGSSDTSNQNGYYNGAGGAGDMRGKLVSSVVYLDPNRGNNVRNRKVPIVPRGLDSALMVDGLTTGDWDTGIGAHPDGPFINPADQCSANKSQSGGMLYYDSGGYINGAGVVDSGSSFSPNRQICSAVAFGSLPSGIDPGAPENPKPWQTLLFCKNPLGGQAHPGFGVPRSAGAALAPPYSIPPDHMLLDLFNMPIVEPYAISEPFSTAGKVNMNYQIVPFTYLTRDTGVRAVLKSTNIMAIPTGHGDRYKLNSTATPTQDYRYSLNLDEKTGTLAGFEQRFNSGDIFRSASEICDLYLVPKDSVDASLPSANATYASMDTWWNNYKLTGDNVRESPYGNIYPRLTTKSNTYTVHVRTQSLKKIRNTAADEFVEGQDQVVSEYRGSFVVQRYLDPNGDGLVKADGRTPATDTDADAMVGPYKIRVLSSKRFAP
ncbi:MAG TPA: Verru_Chthon cassette protein A [Chthoniobacter sp.]|nr:Verru_Chthon cassette protein A [Chthoniobacter sp.]